MMNKKIQLPNGCYWEQARDESDHGCVYNANGAALADIFEETAQILADAMMSTPTEWRDISSVPKTGPNVMLLNADRVLVMSMSPEHFWKTKDYPNHLRFFATHWAPIKLPPTQPDTNKEEV